MDALDALDAMYALDALEANGCRGFNGRMDAMNVIVAMDGMDVVSAMYARYATDVIHVDACMSRMSWMPDFRKIYRLKNTTVLNKLRKNTSSAKKVKIKQLGFWNKPDFFAASSPKSPLAGSA